MRRAMGLPSVRCRMVESFRAPCPGLLYPAPAAGAGDSDVHTAAAAACDAGQAFFCPNGCSVLCSLRIQYQMEAGFDPMEEEVVQYMRKMKLEGELEQRIRNREAAPVGLAKKKCKYEPLASYQLGMRTEATKCAEINRDQRRTAKLQLLEIYAANSWIPPSFILSEEGGADQPKRFTYMVKITIETFSSTILECFSEPKTRREEAEEHAASAALWFLKHLGHSN